MSEASHAEIDVSQAVRIAKQYVQKTFADDHVENVALEEVKFDESSKDWLITVGFSYPWDKPRPIASRQLADFMGQVLETKRTYKLVRLSSDGRVLDVSIRTI